MNLLLWLNPGKRAKHHRAQSALEAQDNVQNVGILAEALWLGDSKMQQAAERALIGLLPQMRSADASLLNTEQRHCLHRALGILRPELSLAILKALEQAGDSRALPYVARLAQSNRSAEGQQERVRQAAQACLPYLQLRAEQQAIHQTSLRASDAPSIWRDYLRSASPPDQEKPSRHKGSAA